ncbi:MAG: hypothetical protein HUU22_03820 [Phycisphaerae bacterium]|nr:dockerin type I repeat-containing protein [Phycisphaerae bacterium]NUQ45144.1 hypothetical protein [Phycisphaerae bacterium]
MLAVMLAGTSTAVPAAAQTWTGASLFSNLWSDDGNPFPPSPGNWVGNVVPVPGPTTILTFGNAGLQFQPFQDIASPFDFNQLNFVGGNVPLTLNGLPIRMAGTTPSISQESSLPHRINNEIILPTTNTFYDFTGNGTGALTLGGPVSGSGIFRKQGSHTLILDAVLSASQDSSVALTLTGGMFRVLGDNLIAPELHLFLQGGTFDLNGRDQTFAMMWFQGSPILLNGGRLTLGINPGVGGGSVGGLNGGGELIKGPGSTQFTASNPNFTGLVRIQGGGTVFLQANGALGDTTTGTVVEAGGSLFVNTNYTMPEPLTLDGNNTGTAALAASGTTTSFAGPITLTADSDFGTAGGTFTLTGGIDTNGFTLLHAYFSGTTVINNNGVTGSGGLRKVTTNETLIINAPCTYTGSTVVERGVLEVNNTLETSSISVQSLGTLRGHCTAPAAPLALAGRLQPGGSVGQIAVAAATLSAGARIDWEISDPAGSPGTGHDVLTLSGVLSAPYTSGVTTIFVSSLTPGGAAGPLAGFDPSQSYLWPIIVAGSVDANVSLSDFALNTTGFTNHNNIGCGAFHLELTTTGLNLRFDSGSAGPGDLNCDCQIDAADVPLFVQALIDPSQFGGCDFDAADMNGDNSVDADDVQLFVDAVY